MNGRRHLPLGLASPHSAYRPLGRSPRGGDGPAETPEGELRWALYVTLSPVCSMPPRFETCSWRVASYGTLRGGCGSPRCFELWPVERVNVPLLRLAGKRYDRIALVPAVPIRPMTPDLHRVRSRHRSQREWSRKGATHGRQRARRSSLSPRFRHRRSR